MGDVDPEDASPRSSRKKRHHPWKVTMLTLNEDTDWWAVWVGRHALENLTSVPKGQLRWFSTPPTTVRGKAGLTWIRTIRIDDAKAGPNEPTSLISEGGR